MLPLGEISKKLELLNGWSLEIDSIVKDFEFSDFKSALEFVNSVGEIAERENHHPDILINFNKVRLSLTTNLEHGLTSRDFEVAGEIDKIKTTEKI